MVDDKMPQACLRARSLLEAFGTGAQQNLAALCGHFQLWPSAGKGWVGLVARYSLGGGEVYHSESRDLGVAGLGQPRCGSFLSPGEISQARRFLLHGCSLLPGFHLPVWSDVSRLWL